MPYKNSEKDKEYHREYGKKYYQRNKEKIRRMARENEQRPEVKKRRKEHRKNYYETHKEMFRSLKKRYHEEHREEILKDGKRYYQEHKEEKREYERRHKNDKRHTSPEYKLRENLRRRLHQALKVYTNTGKIYSSKEYGIDYKAIIEHLKPFPADFSSGSYNAHHLKPLCTFKFINEDGTQNLEAIKEAFKPENHKIITEEEHKEIHKNGIQKSI